MYNLVFKDFLIQKKNILISLLLALAYTFMFSSKMPSYVIYLAIPIMITYLLMMNACNYDDKNNSQILFCSIPINREDLVVAKYITSFAFFIMGICEVLLSFYVLGISNIVRINGEIKLSYIMIGVIIIAIGSAVYYPIYFKLGYAKSQFFLVAIFFAGFFGPMFIEEIVKSNKFASVLVNISSAPQAILYSLAIAIVLIILIISIWISIRIYKAKDL
ncbi:ABC-2 transporter permease [Clostridium sp. 19966]|uniref:ABC-2 transporter permease n=1 Tax=Clostridium sp. 19966 TaxID=2768166 RepID=UPI0028DF0367|nr:ABC-2 transporter permease [Clostridium sp. 19966]MDT8719490.1 ABC-2 transporter permease [Clostridium sp. 19966]